MTSLILGSWLGTERDRRNRIAVLRWSLLLAAAVVGSAWVLRAGLGISAALRGVTVALTIALVVPWLLSHLRFIREADELIRKIQFEALALGFWAAFTFGVLYIVLGHMGLPGLQPASGVPLMVAIMGLGYGVGRVLASKRYR